MIRRMVSALWVTAAVGLLATTGWRPAPAFAAVSSSTFYEAETACTSDLAVYTGDTNFSGGKALPTHIGHPATCAFTIPQGYTGQFRIMSLYHVQARPVLLQTCLSGMSCVLSNFTIPTVGSGVVFKQIVYTSPSGLPAGPTSFSLRPPDGQEVGDGVWLDAYYLDLTPVAADPVVVDSPSPSPTRPPVAASPSPTVAPSPTPAPASPSPVAPSPTPAASVSPSPSLVTPSPTGSAVATASPSASVVASPSPSASPVPVVAGDWATPVPLPTKTVAAALVAGLVTLGLIWTGIEMGAAWLTDGSGVTAPPAPGE